MTTQDSSLASNQQPEIADKLPARRLPAWLIVLYVMALLTILGWPIVAFASIFAFDAPGSAQNPGVWATVITLLAYPLIPLVFIPGSFFAFRRDHRRLAYTLAGIGSIPLLIAIIALVAMSLSTILVLLRH